MIYKVDEIIRYMSNFNQRLATFIYTGCPRVELPVLAINDRLEGYIEERKVLDSIVSKELRNGLLSTKYIGCVVLNRNLITIKMND